MSLREIEANPCYKHRYLTQDAKRSVYKLGKIKIKTENKYEFNIFRFYQSTFVFCFNLKTCELSYLIALVPF